MALFRQEVVDSQRQRLWGDVLLVQPLSFYLLTTSVLIIVMLVGLLLTFGTFARRENVTGYLVPDRGLVKVYAPQSGIITKVHVEEGDLVDKEDILFTVTTRKTTDAPGDVDAAIVSELMESRTQSLAALDNEARLSELTRAHLEDEISGLVDEVTQIKEQMRTHEEQRRVSLNRLNALKKLVKQNYLANSQYQELYESHLDNQLRLEEAKRSLISKSNQLDGLRNQREQLPVKSAIRAAELKQSLSELNQRLAEIRGRRMATIRAPESGRITALQAASGQAAVTNTPLLAILPQDTHLEAALFVPTRAIGFVKPAQRVLLRYSAFPYQRFGLHEGTITEVAEVILSPDELSVPVPLKEPAYRVTVAPNSQMISAFGRDLPLQAGMLLDADIILYDRTLAQWLLEPLYSLTGRLSG